MIWGRLGWFARYLPDIENCVYAYDTKNGIVFVGADGYLNTVVLKTDIKAGNQVKQ
jgi:hypothetical protein